MREWDGDQEPKLYYVDTAAANVSACESAPPALVVRVVLDRARVSSMDYWPLRNFVKYQLGLTILDIKTIALKQKPRLL